MLSQSQQGSTLISVTSFTNTSDILPIWAHLNGLVTLLNAWDQWSCLSWQDLYPSFWVIKTRIQDSSHFCTWKFGCLWLPLERQFWGFSSLRWYLDSTPCSIRVSQILKANSSFGANKDAFSNMVNKEHLPSTSSAQGLVFWREASVQTQCATLI